MALIHAATEECYFAVEMIGFYYLAHLKAVVSALAAHPIETTIHALQYLWGVMFEVVIGPAAGNLKANSVVKW